MYNFGSFDAFIVKPTIMPDFARNLLHYKGTVQEDDGGFCLVLAINIRSKINKIGRQYYELLWYLQLLNYLTCPKKVYNAYYLIDRISLLNHRLQEISDHLFADAEQIVGHQLNIAGPFS